MPHFINHNGEIIENTVPVYTADNRAFQYGDSLFETIRFVNGRPLFFEDHFHRLLSGMVFLQLKFDEKLDMGFFYDKVLQLCALNEQTKVARVRITFYRKQGGYYTPENSGLGYLIQTSPLDEPLYNLGAKGLKIDVYNESLKPLGNLSNLKTGNSLPFILAGLYKKQKNLDDCLLLNTAGFVAEAISSNVFMVKNGLLLSPPLSDGCVAGIMRMQILKIARLNNKKVLEKSLSIEELLFADEIFLSNAISGIRWVVAFRNKRYFNTTAKWFTEQLNSIPNALEL